MSSSRRDLALLAHPCMPLQDADARHQNDDRTRDGWKRAATVILFVAVAGGSLAFLGASSKAWFPTYVRPCMRALRSAAF